MGFALSNSEKKHTAHHPPEAGFQRASMRKRARETLIYSETVIASVAKQSLPDECISQLRDCFVVSLLAMTNKSAFL
jgi:hypothetical protein